MGTRFNIQITAQDAATARIRAIKQALANVVSPITSIGNSVKSLGKETGVNRLAAGLGGVGKEAADAVKSLGGMGAALAGGLGIASIAAYSREWAMAQSATYRFSLTSGVAVGRLQAMEGGARLAGLSADDLHGSIQSLGQTLNDARWGRNAAAQTMMVRLGMQMKTTKDGAIDTGAALGDIAQILGPGGKLGKADIQTKTNFAAMFGVESMLPVLVQGRKAWEDYQAAAAKVKPPLTPDQQKAAVEYAKQINLLALSFDGMANSIMTSVTPSLGGLLSMIIAHNVQIEKNIRLYGLWGSISRGAWKTTKDVVKGIGWAETKVIQHSIDMFKAPKDDRAGYLGDWNKLFNNRPKVTADPKTEKESIQDFRRMGWSDAQAKGIVANMMAESRLDPKAVGDNGAAKGAMQWHKDRQQNYARWAMDRRDVGGKTIDAASLADQRKFVDYELRDGAEQKAGRRLAQQTDAGNAAYGLSQDYVRPAARMAEAARRGVTAQDLDKAFPAEHISAALNAARKPDAPAAQGIGQIANNMPSAPAGPLQMQHPPAMKKDAPLVLPAAAQPGPDRGATDLPWLSQGGKAAPATSPSELHVTFHGLPSGVKAQVLDSKGPVKTNVKVETSMPEYN